MVEDDREFSKTAGRLLELKGWEVRTAPDVATARQMLKESTSDVVLMDIELPGGNGIDLCREIRASSDVPVIFISGLKKTDELVESARGAGGDAFITKPVNFNELALRVEALLRRAEKAAKSALGA